MPASRSATATGTRAALTLMMRIMLPPLRVIVPPPSMVICLAIDGVLVMTIVLMLGVQLKLSTSPSLAP